MIEFKLEFQNVEFKVELFHRMYLPSNSEYSDPYLGLYLGLKINL